MDHDGGMDERNEWNILSGRAIPGTRSLLQTTVVIGPGFNSMIVKGGGGGGACKRKKKKKKRTKLRSFCDSKLLHLRKSRFRGVGRGWEGKDVACGGLLYKIFWNAVLLYVCIRPFILIFFNIRVFHSPGSDKGFMLAFMRKRERERKKQRGGKRYRNYSTDSLPKRNNGQTNGNWFEFANDTGSRTRSAISFSFPSIPLGDACEKKKEGKESIRKFRFVTKRNKIYFLTSKSRQSFRNDFYIQRPNTRRIAVYIAVTACETNNAARIGGFTKILCKLIKITEWRSSDNAALTVELVKKQLPWTTVALGRGRGGYA